MARCCCASRPGTLNSGPTTDLLLRMRLIFRQLPLPKAHAAIVALTLAAGLSPSVAAGAAGTDVPPPSSLDWLLPQRFHGSSHMLPGDRWEGSLTGERSLALTPRLEWQTSTDLNRIRYEQLAPVREQGFRLSTGPMMRLGAAELSLPWNVGHDANSVSGRSTWSGGAPRMTVALGPNDRIRLEAKISRRKDAGATQRKRTTSLSWRHSFGDAWSMSAGLREIREAGEADARITGETWASLDARFSGWRWSLASSLSEARGTGTIGLQPAQRTASLSVSTRYRLSDGWWISGELKSTQTHYTDEQRPLVSHSGGMKLFRDF